MVERREDEQTMQEIEEKSKPPTLFERLSTHTLLLLAAFVLIVLYIVLFGAKSPVDVSSVEKNSLYAFIGVGLLIMFILYNAKETIQEALLNSEEATYALKEGIKAKQVRRELPAGEIMIAGEGDYLDWKSPFRWKFGFAIRDDEGGLNKNYSAEIFAQGSLIGTIGPITEEPLGYTVKDIASEEVKRLQRKIQKIEWLLRKKRYMM